jgi:putative FmdB family regulatory protein
MVTHDYRCGTCKVVQEFLHSPTEPEPVCPVCGGNMARLVCAPAGIGVQGERLETHAIAGFDYSQVPKSEVYSHRSRDGTKR